MRGDRSARLAAVSAYKTGSGMIAYGLTQRRFLFRLRFGHALIDALENLFFGEAGIFQAADCRSAECRLAPQSAVQNYIHRRTGKSHQPEHDGVSADDFELIGFRNLQNL